MTFLLDFAASIHIGSSSTLLNFGIRLRILKPIETPLHPMWPPCYFEVTGSNSKIHGNDSLCQLTHLECYIKNRATSLFTVASLSQAVAWRRTCHLCQFLRSLYTRSDISRSISYAHIVLDPGRFLNFGYSKWMFSHCFLFMIQGCLDYHFSSSPGYFSFPKPLPSLRSKTRSVLEQTNGMSLSTNCKEVMFQHLSHGLKLTLLGGFPSFQRFSLASC